MYEGVWVVFQINIRAIDFDCTHTYSGAPINRGDNNTLSTLNLMPFALRLCHSAAIRGAHNGTRRLGHYKM